jgi:hypothetical protein
MALIDFIEVLRAKPVPVRRRIALLTAAGVTAAVSLVWGVATASSGVFALGTPPPETAQLTASMKEQGSVAASVFSAAAQLSGANKEENAITVVTASSSSTLAPKPQDDRTSIPF